MMNNSLSKKLPETVGDAVVETVKHLFFAVIL